MKTKFLIFFLLAAVAIGCKSPGIPSKTLAGATATIDLLHVENDRVKVTMQFPATNQKTVIFNIPKIVPGTYSSDNYGQFIENFEAVDTQGNPLPTKRLDDNRWEIAQAARLKAIHYEVNDTFDMEREGGVFSPAGTNIEKDRNFMLNLHGFVGYLDGMENLSYTLHIERPSHFYPGTALDFESKNTASNTTVDDFKLERYFEVTDNPIMYAKPDTLSFSTGGMQIVLALYSATGKYKAEDLRPVVVKTMTAQKRFLGEIDNTDKYAILLYLSDDSKPDARGTGALEHNRSTVVVFSESISQQNLERSIVDVVSHEFFHILTPLNVHSEEIHNFNYNHPKMSKHLWMYEGVTEYFAQLFQVNQGLCSREEFFERMAEKINTSKQFDDTVPFTLMSENILTDEHKNSFYNVYQKGALIAMCLDIKLRELSQGETGLLDVMRKLGRKYGKHKPFEDEMLFEEIIALTYPEIQHFFETYVAGETPIPYNEFLQKVGLVLKEGTVETSYFLKGNIPYFDLDTDTGKIVFRKRLNYNSFLRALGIQGGDVFMALNGNPISLENIRQQVLESIHWPAGKEVSVTIGREGQTLVRSTITQQPTEMEWEIGEMQRPSPYQEQLQTDWLKN